MDAITNLMERRAIRAYLPKQITDEELDTVLRAGTYAPTGHNWQSPVIVVVQDPETIALLSRMNAEILNQPGTDPFFGAPTVLIVLADRRRPTHVCDGSLVLGNLMNAAHAVGLGSCWVNRAREEFERDEGRALLKRWGIEGDYVGIGHCLLGYPDGPAPPPPPARRATLSGPNKKGGD